MSGDQGAERSWPGILGLLLICALVFWPALDSRDFWQTDEIRYAEAARQMGEYGHPWIPHLNASVYPEKPPFFFWTVMGLEKLCGDYKLASRMTGALGVSAAALGIVFLCRLLGAGARAGVISALLFVSMVTPLSRGQVGLIDSLLVGLCTWALVCLLAGARAAGLWRRLAWAAGATLFLAAGCMCKGPVALLVPLLASAFLARRLPSGRTPWLAMSCVSVLAMGSSLLWLYLASQEIGDWMWDYMLFGQISTRSGEAAQHAEPWHYYLSRVLPLGLMPWTLLLPGTYLLAQRGRGEPVWGAAFCCFLLALGITLLFSLLSGKRVGYLLPIFPLFAAGMGLSIWRGAAGIMELRILGRWPIQLLSFALLLVASACILLPWLGPSLAGLLGERAEEARQLIAALPWYLATAAGLLLAMAWRASRRALQDRRPERVVYMLAMAIAGMSALAHFWVIPVADGFRSPRAFYAAVLEQAKEGDRLVLFGTISFRAINWYAKRERFEILSVDDMPGQLAVDDRLLVLADRRAWPSLSEDLRGRFEALSTGGHEHRRYVLYRERD